MLECFSNKNGKLFLCQFVFSSIYFVLDSRIIIMYVIVENYPLENISYFTN